MNLEEANQQIGAFFGRLGEKKASFFERRTHVEARIGEALVGFEYEPDLETLAAQALVYRFRAAPADRVLDAIFAEEDESNSGGGRLVFNSENNAFYLQRDFTEKVGDNVFYEGVNRLALASLRWNAEILARAAEKAG